MFSKRIEIKQPWIITESGLTNLNTSRHTHNQQQGSSCISFGFGDIKAPCLTNPPI